MTTDKVPAVEAMADYLAIKAFSSGMAHTLLTQCPLEAWLDSPWNPDREQAESEVADIGTYAHACLLEGGTDKLFSIDPEQYRSKPTKANPEGNIPKGWGNNAIRQARDDAKARGDLPVLKESVDAVKAMVETAKAFIATSPLAAILEIGKTEQTIVWKDSGILCKARPDILLPDGTMIHYKTTKRSVRPESFARTIVNMGYDISMMFYARAVQNCPGQYLLAQQQHGSYACQLFALTPAQAEISSVNVARAIRIWAECQKLGEYPAYSSEIFYVEPTPWQLAQAEQNMAEDELTEEELEGGIPG